MTLLKITATKGPNVPEPPAAAETGLMSSPGTQTRRRGLKLQTGARVGSQELLVFASDLASATERLQLFCPFCTGRRGPRSKEPAIHTGSAFY